MTGLPDDESSLIAAAAAGHATAFSELFARHAPAIVSLVTVRLRDPAHAHDVTQEVFLRLFRSLDTFRGQAALRTWLVRVALNCCTDLERRNARHGAVRADDAQPTAAVVHGSQEDDAIQRGEARRLRAAVQQLPDDLRLLVSLRYDGDLPYADIASILGLPMGTIATRLARALRLLHQILGPRR